MCPCACTRSRCRHRQVDREPVSDACARARAFSSAHCANAPCASHVRRWARAAEVAPNGFAAIFDANGVATLKSSYEALAQTGTRLCPRAPLLRASHSIDSMLPPCVHSYLPSCPGGMTRACACSGTLVIYGFHSNLPHAALLNPLAWISMVGGVLRMPRFDPMDLVISSKVRSDLPAHRRPRCRRLLSCHLLVPSERRGLQPLLLRRRARPCRLLHGSGAPRRHPRLPRHPTRRLPPLTAPSTIDHVWGRSSNGSTRAR